MLLWITFFRLKKSPKITILGDMFELGDESFEEHQKIVDLASSYPEVEIYFVGKHFFQTKKEINHIHFFETFESFSKLFKQISFKII